jgi:heptosyltransferase-2/heptosyltransferase-3
VFIDEMAQRPDEHWVDRLLRFGSATPAAFVEEDYPFVPGDFRSAPQLAACPADRADRDAWLRQRGFGDRPIVLLQTGNKRSIKWGRRRRNDSKAWPEQYWIGLLQEMHWCMPSAVLLLCGSPREFAMLEDLRNSAQMESVATAARDLPLGRLLALCEIAHCMVSVDSGPAHLAAAVGCPLVVLYGAESPQRWDRRSPNGRPVINVGGPPHTTSVGDIALTSVIDAWHEVLRWHDRPATQRNARSSAHPAITARTR